jgi:hypothetical protein
MMEALSSSETSTTLRSIPEDKASSAYYAVLPSTLFVITLNVLFS